MLRLGLRSLHATVLNSIDDHRHEVMSFVWENGYHGVMSDDGEYPLFNPPRYFSAHDIKLSLQQVNSCIDPLPLFRINLQLLITNYLNFNISYIDFAA